MTATEKLFAQQDTAGAMRALVERAAGNRDVIAGLEKAVVEYILEKIGVTEDRASEYLAFIARNEPALAILFDEAEMQTYRNVAADLRRSLPTQSVEPAYRNGRVQTTGPRRGWRRLFGR